MKKICSNGDNCMAETQIQPESEFYSKGPTYGNALFAQCKTCMRARSLNRYNADKLKTAAATIKHMEHLCATDRASKLFDMIGEGTVDKKQFSTVWNHFNKRKTNENGEAR